MSDNGESPSNDDLKLAMVTLSQNIEEFKTEVREHLATLLTGKDTHETKIKALLYHANPAKHLLDELKASLLAHQMDCYRKEQTGMSEVEMIHSSAFRGGLATAIKEIDDLLLRV